MDQNDEELVRIKITRAGYRSSVSMDFFLASTLQAKLGGEVEFKAWVQSTVNELERQWQEAALGAKAGSRARARSGLSRMIQREAIRRVLA